MTEKIATRKAYTARSKGGYPMLVIEFEGCPSAYVDIFQKRPIVDAGVVTLFPLDSEKGLTGFETIEAEFMAASRRSRRARIRHQLTTRSSSNLPRRSSIQRTTRPSRPESSSFRRAEPRRRIFFFEN
ncbi:MAG: hypothetical protein LC113_09685 [Acidobacteria bacterium]|nr:hypothetical protein [Acidobacteriota bacterium]